MQLLLHSNAHGSVTLCSVEFGVLWAVLGSVTVVEEPWNTLQLMLLTGWGNILGLSRHSAECFCWEHLFKNRLWWMSCCGPVPQVRLAFISDHGGHTFSRKGSSQCTLKDIESNREATSMFFRRTCFFFFPSKFWAHLNWKFDGYGFLHPRLWQRWWMHLVAEGTIANIWWLQQLLLSMGRAIYGPRVSVSVRRLLQNGAPKMVLRWLA